MDTKVIKVKKNGGDISLEVGVSHQKPAAISVARYGADGKKTDDLGSAFSMTPPDPDIFSIAKSSNISGLNENFIAIVVAISSFNPQPNEHFAVTATMRQDGKTIENGHIIATGSVVNGGAGMLLSYQLIVG